MRRLKKEIKSNGRLGRFQLRVSRVNTRFKWNECCWCDYEFRREYGYEIYMCEHLNNSHNSETYYVCNKCSNGVPIEDMMEAWENSKLYDTFKHKCYDK